MSRSKAQRNILNALAEISAARIHLEKALDFIEESYPYEFKLFMGSKVYEQQEYRQQHIKGE